MKSDLFDKLKAKFKRKPKPVPVPEPDSFPDEIHPADIKWLDKNIGGWKIVSSLIMRRAGNDLVYEQQATSRWEPRGPGAGQVVGNAWVIVKFDGQWYAVTNEFFRPGQQHKGIASVTAANGHIDHPLFKGWNPANGEQYGFMASTLCRGAATNGQERTQIKLYTWR